MVGAGGFHGGGLALKTCGDVAARVHDDVLFASGEPLAFEHWQHLAARLVDVDDAAAIGGCRIVQCPLDLLLAQFSEVSVSLLRATPSRARPWVSK